MTDKTFTLTIQLSEERYRALEEQARQHDYEDPAAYLLALAEQDTEEDDVDADFTKERILENFKEAWHDAMTGNTYPADVLWDDEFWNSIDDE